jgi:arrestin-related trafficking adapter 3/6
MASLRGPGPWTLQMALTVPSAEGVLHFSNKNKGAPIEISHTLKVVVRVQRDDEQEVDSHTGKPKKFDITMRTPVHILSVRPLHFLKFDYFVDVGLCL